MKKILLMGLCFSLCLTMTGCNKTKASGAAQENSGGSGFEVVEKSIISLSDLYFFSINTTKSQVLAALGSPQKETFNAGGEVTYLLENGAYLKLTYNDREIVKTATYIDESGTEQNLFELLVDQKVLVSIGSAAQSQNTGVGEQATEGGVQMEEGKPSGGGNQGATGGGIGHLDIADEESNYFSSERYGLDVAAQLLKVGEKRKKILSALGRPNNYSSITFEKKSYLIDVYYMEDGSVYYLDYGYDQEALRAVRGVKGGKISTVVGSWEQEKWPKDFYYNTRNQSLFSSLKKGSKPSEIYRQYGEADWYEGREGNFKDAYQLRDGAVLYLDFGSGHNLLKAASVQKKDGTTVPIALR